MRKLLAAAMTAGLLVGGAGLAHAKGPDPSGPAKFGLCNAWSSGSAQGQAMKQQHGQAFQNLAAAAAAANESVAQYCDGATPGGK